MEVPAWEWADLEMQVSPAARDMLCFRQNPRTNVYQDVLFAQRDVLKVWCPHVRSDLDERGDFSITPIVDDEDARSALYQRIAALDLPMSSTSPATPARRMRDWTPTDLEALKALNVQVNSDRGSPLTSTETISWAKERGISRDRVRELRDQLPEDLKLKRGQRPN
jgi:hypothetical protein